MPLEQVLALLQARPFIPFRLHLLDGTSFEIRHPELLMAGARSLTIGVNANPALTYYERAATVALLHVSRLEPILVGANGG
jgi:hypothetical protein